MHLQRSHDFYMAEYEAKQPEPDTEVKKGASKADTDLAAAETDDESSKVEIID